MPVDTVATEKGPSYGAALLAMVGCGAYDSVRAACDACVSLSGTTLPDKKLTADYDKRYNVFRLIYPAMKGVFKAMKD